MSRRFLLCAVLIVAAVCFKAFFLEQIHSRSLRDFDEARYAEVAHNTIRTGNWIIPLAGGPDEPRDVPYTTLENGNAVYPYFWKPPLHTQIIALFMEGVGVGELAVRLPTLIFALGTCLLLYLFAKRLFPQAQWTPLIATLFFISTTDFSMLLGQGLAEMQLLFFSLAAVYYATYKTRSAAVLCGITFGLAFLTKSFITFWVPVLVAFVLFDRHNLKEWGVQLAYAALTALLIIIPWHWAMYVQFGDLFIQRYLLTNSAGRTSGATGNIAPPQWYFIYMLDQWKPYVFVVPILAARLLSKLHEKDRSVWVLVVWLLIMLVPLSMARSKVYWYIFPLWVPTSILLAAALEWAYEQGRRGVLIAAIALALFSTHSYWQLNPHHIPLKPFVMVCLIGGMSSWWLWRRPKRVAGLLFTICVTCILLLAQVYSIRARAHQTDENRDLRTLLQRHPNLPELTPMSYPYEAALFYSHIGNMQLYTPQARYLFAAAPLEDPTIRSQFMAIDREGRFVLYRKIR